MNREVISLALFAVLGAVMSFAGTAVFVEQDTETQFDRTCHALADTRAEESFCVRLVLDASD